MERIIARTIINRIVVDKKRSWITDMYSANDEEFEQIVVSIDFLFVDTISFKVIERNYLISKLETSSIAFDLAISD